MALTALDLAKLAYPFRRDDHEFLQGYVYIQEEAITERLDTVDPNWSISIDEAIGYGDSVVFLSTLTVKDVRRSNAGGNPVQREKKDKTVLDQYSQADNGVNAHKGAATDALKRCARMFGIGRYLLSAPKEGKAFDDWLVEERIAAKARLDAVRTVDATTGEITPKGGVEPHQPPPSPSAQPTPASVSQTGIPEQQRPNGNGAPSQNTPPTGAAGANGGSAKSDLFPDTSPVKHYTCTEVRVVKFGSGKQAQLKRADGGEPIVLLGRAKLIAAGYPEDEVNHWIDTLDTWFPLKPSADVEAAFDGAAWEVGAINQLVRA